jgi:hypothetical protein
MWYGEISAQSGDDMRIFWGELRKFLSLKVILILAVLAVLFYFALLRDSVSSFVSLQTHGIYGAYQTEMFQKYGTTLEAEELADFDIEGKIAEQIEVVDAIIGENPVYAEYQIGSYQDWLDFEDRYLNQLMNGVDDPIGSDPAKLELDYNEMRSYLNGGSSPTLDEWYNSPLSRIRHLDVLRISYVEFGGYREFENKDYFISKPVVVQNAIKDIVVMGNANLVAYHLPGEFSIYASVAAVFCIWSVLFLVCPVIVGDRQHGIHSLAYSSKIGRKMLRIQFGAAVAGTLLVSVVLKVALWLPFICAGAGEYWNARIMGVHLGGRIILYNITFGQFALLLGGMTIFFSVCAACLGLLLSRFSANSVVALLKVIPAGAALSGVCIASMYQFTYEENFIFDVVFHKTIRWPELMVTAVVTASLVLAALVMLRRERRVDVG